MPRVYRRARIMRIEPNVCAFTHVGPDADHSAGYVSDSLEGLLDQMADDGVTASNFTFYNVGAPLKLSLELK